MSDTSADTLRARWHQLQAEHAELMRRTEALAPAGDADALREHNQHLHAHVEQLHALMIEMEKYHKTHGPIGGLAEPQNPG